MLATPTNISIGQASSYYNQERGYYMEPGKLAQEKKWYGKLMEHYKLELEIEREKFDQLIQEHAGKQKELDLLNIKNGTSLKAQTGIDLVFSVPKSFSIAMHTDEAYRDIIMEGHQKAVEKALDHIEQNYIFYRQWHGKKLRLHHQSDNMLVARIDHHASRSEDMDYHTHAVILNKTKGKDGKIRVISNQRIYKNQKIISQIYNNVLFDFCKDRGFKLRVVDKEKSFYELEGISREQIEIFSKRWKEIQEKLKEMEWDDTPKNRKKIYEMTRRRKEKVELADLEKKWKEEIKAAAIELPKIENIQILELQDPDEKKAILEKALARVSRQGFAFRNEDFYLAAMKEGMESGIHLRDAKAFIESKSELLQHEKNGEKYYLPVENFELERDIYRRIADGLGQASGVDIVRVRKELENSQLSEEQRRAVEFVTTSKERYVGIQGFAGVGKTFMFNKAREIWESEGYTIRGMSPVGVAARNLQDEAGIQSSTIHRFLNQLEKEAGNYDRDENFETKEKWRFEGLKESPGREIWIVDESSMLSNRLLGELQRAADIRKAKVVLAGCFKQMQAIGEGSVFRDLIMKNAISHATLTEIRRQRDELLKSAVYDVIKGNVKESLRKLGSKTFQVDQKTARFQMIAESYAKRSDVNRDKTLIITGMNRDRREINYAVRKKLIEKGELSPEGIEITVREQNNHRTKLVFTKDDKVMFLKNDRALGVQNGTRGKIEDVNEKRMVVQVGDRKIDVDLKKYNNLTHGYTLTPYKAQGLGEEKVLINLDTRQRSVNSRNAYYVDISRGKKEVLIYTNNKKDLARAFEEEQGRLSYRDFEQDFKRQAQELERQGVSPELELAREELKPEIEQKQPGIERDFERENGLITGLDIEKGPEVDGPDFE